MKIDIVVHGRFWAFNFANALIQRGHDVRVLTNYPSIVVEGFGVDRKFCASNLWHGVSSRVAHRFNRLFNTNYLESELHSNFGRWAARRVRRDCEAVYCFSGVAEEVLRKIKRFQRPPLGVLVRGSAHIRTQRDLLEAEEARWGGRVEKPSNWMIAREEREYASADRILVLSEFARQSFIEQGVADYKLVLSNLGVDIKRFKPTAEQELARRNRILAGEPLRVLTVGSLSPRKGALDLFAVVGELKGRMKFRFVGDCERDAAARASKISPDLELQPRVPEHRLPEVYAWADIFVFPTIEDGFAAVLAQAASAGLPLICTENCGGPDLLRAGATGWCVAKRTPDQIVARLRWCDANRQQYAELLAAPDASRFNRDWQDTADDFARTVDAHTLVPELAHFQNRATRNDYAGDDERSRQTAFRPPNIAERDDTRAVATPHQRIHSIDIVVHGRFFAFNLAQGLIQQGHDVRVLTNYPSVVAARFGVPQELTVPYVWHGVSSRVLHRAGSAVNRRLMEPWLHQAFGRWAAPRVRADAEAIVCFSGIAEEVFSHLAQTSRAQKILVRGSAHIREQHRLLAEEQRRSGMMVETPSPWMVEREEREYALADQIVVLSTFALESFRRNGVPGNKLSLIGLGADTSQFRPSPIVAAERRFRILHAPRLRVLMVGSLTPQKGALDYIDLVKALGDKVDFRFVGDLPGSVRELLARDASEMQVFGRVAEHQLPAEYAWADLFVFPTIQDGYAVVIAQALASGLPVICTTNCAGRDVVVEGENGWVVPIRDVAALVRAVQECDANRVMLADMSTANAENGLRRDWDDVAVDFSALLAAH
jgi:glycosyltransferase involved in cell wall biosynthesis